MWQSGFLRPPIKGQLTRTIVGEWPTGSYTSSVSVLVSVHLGIRCGLLRADAPGMTANSLCLQHNACWCVQVHHCPMRLRVSCFWRRGYGLKRRQPRGPLSWRCAPCSAEITWPSPAAIRAAPARAQIGDIEEAYGKKTGTSLSSIRSHSLRGATVPRGSC